MSHQHNLLLHSGAAAQVLDEGGYVLGVIGKTGIAETGVGAAHAELPEGVAERGGLPKRRVDGGEIDGLRAAGKTADVYEGVAGGGVAALVGAGPACGGGEGVDCDGVGHCDDGAVDASQVEDF